MRVVLQRVKQAEVKVRGEIVAQIGQGVCLLVGVERGDDEQVVNYLARKVAELRIFPDNQGKMNLSLLEFQGEALVVSQFTLAASLRKGRRPSFDHAEHPERAEKIYQMLVKKLENYGLKVVTGQFQAVMEVSLINDGPVTFVLEKSPKE
ncbi:MAG: D-tyrosyl-tRNA(Tyr) deacylase [Candidatus Aminicenantes bacterium 4484_214]|nr:MAG: D-tyrosyl-tRNA(Tyr) deacylase [Candidatus Aminicenantes bacterium 4484_214]